jgi:hypothetical protein
MVVVWGPMLVANNGPRDHRKRETSDRGETPGKTGMSHHIVRLAIPQTAPLVDTGASGQFPIGQANKRDPGSVNACCGLGLDPLEPEFASPSHCSARATVAVIFLVASTESTLPPKGG